MDLARQRGDSGPCFYAPPVTFPKWQWRLVWAAPNLLPDVASAVTGVALPVDCGLMPGNIVLTRELTPEDT